MMSSNSSNSSSSSKRSNRTTTTTNNNNNIFKVVERIFLTGSVMYLREMNAAAAAGAGVGGAKRMVAWCVVLVTVNQWLQFDVGPATLITGVVTKGRGDGHKKHWVTKFRLSYSNDSTTWHFYKDAAHLHINVT